MPTTIFDSVQYLKSIGPKKAEGFNEVGIYTIYDLIFYHPSKYLDRSKILNTNQILDIVSNGFEDELTIIGKVVSQELVRYGKKQIFKVKFRDDAGYFDCVWFQGIKFFKNRFKDNEVYALSAKPVITRYGHLQFTHPDFDKLNDEESNEFRNTGRIIPFYSVPQKLKAKHIGDLSLRRVIESAVNKFSNKIPESLPQNLINKHNLVPIKTAVENIHFPKSMELLGNALKRFKFEELFYVEILVALKKFNYKNEVKGINFKIDEVKIKQFISSLPFKLTNAQSRTLSEIFSDMSSPKPMNRLIQGDVGSGKTIVALIAMLASVLAGKQAVLMAPTEILANQHLSSFNKLLKKFDVEICLLIGSQSKKERSQVLDSISSGEANIIIGTHAIFEDPVVFKNLGLVVIDEQHRFGVIQKSKLVNKGAAPDVIVMTATPIPRALSLTVYGDLDVSLIDELPANRKQIRTVIRNDIKLPDIYKFIVDKAKEGIQSFIVYPLVEESDKIDLKSAEEYYSTLRKTYFANINVGLIHGKMNWKQKEEVMLQFASHNYDVLISTTVIEVGIDIPKANIILINNANRFGLSQLHQLRGRVGRGTEQAYCILVSDIERPKLAADFNFDFSYLSKEQIEKNKHRIRMSAMEKFSSGFELSEIDLKLRGPGDIFGTKQSGFPEFKYANLIEDRDILLLAKEEAFNIIENDHTLSDKNNEIILKTLRAQYSKNILYSQIA